MWGVELQPVSVIAQKTKENRTFIAVDSIQNDTQCYIFNIYLQSIDLLWFAEVAVAWVADTTKISRMRLLLGCGVMVKVGL